MLLRVELKVFQLVVFGIIVPFLMKLKLLASFSSVSKWILSIRHEWFGRSWCIHVRFVIFVQICCLSISNKNTSIHWPVNSFFFCWASSFLPHNFLNFLVDWLSFHNRLFSNHLLVLSKYKEHNRHDNANSD